MFVAQHLPREAEGEVDLVGQDGATPAFVDVLAIDNRPGAGAGGAAAQGRLQPSEVIGFERSQVHSGVIRGTIKTHQVHHQALVPEHTRGGSLCRSCEKIQSQGDG